MTAVALLGVLLGTMVFAFIIAAAYGTRVRVSILLGCAGAAGVSVTYIVIAAGMLVLGEPS